MRQARLFAALLFVAATQVFADLPPRIPRDVLFGNPERTAPQLSPDGKRLAWLAPDKKNVLQVWVKTLGKDDDRAVRAEQNRGLREYQWARDNKTLLYLQDDDGNENFQLYGEDLDTGNVRDYTAIQGTRASIINRDPGLPDQVLVGLNARDRRYFDAYRLQLSNGALVPDTENPGDVDSWVAGPNNEVMVAVAVDPKDGSTEVRARKNHFAPWKSLVKAPYDENLGVDGISADGQWIYLETSLGSDTARLVRKNIETGEEKPIASSPEVDAGAVIINPYTHVVEAVSFEPGRRTWTIVDPGVKADYDAIAKLADGDFAVINRDQSNKTWLVAFTSDRGPVRW